ncbi:MAG: cell division protein FtsZ [Dehalococcoidales bacterium]|nr:cell division protein FtsZ [Dehalococcoidales bacterium]
MTSKSYVPSPVKIKVIGLGGAGCNAVTRMVREQIRGVEFIVMNTNAAHLAITEAALRVQLGKKITQGIGAGGDHQLGSRAAEESHDEIKQVVNGADMVFVAAGMGGGTGTGSAPMVADIAKRSGALTIAFVTKPFKFEGTRRNQVAEEGICNLIDKVDALIIIPNENLLQISDRKMSIDDTFKMADEVLFHGVRAITDLVTMPGLINLDYANIRTVMKDAGQAWMSIGKGSGPNRAVDAVKDALASPLMDISIKGAKRVLFNVTGGSDLTLAEVKGAAEIIQGAIAPEANVIFGVVLDPNMGNETRITLIATGFTDQEALTGAAREKEILRLLKDKSEDELDVPPLLRQRRVPPGHQ